MQKIFYFLLFCCLTPLLYAQRDSLKLTDSQRSELLAELNADAGKTFTPDSVAAMSDFLRESFSNLGIEKSEKYCQLMLDCAFLTENEANVAMAYHRTGHFYQNFEKYSSAISYYERALAIRERLDLKKEIADTKGNMGMVYTTIKETDRGVALMQEALEIYKKLGRSRDVERMETNILNIKEQNIEVMDYPFFSKEERSGLLERLSKGTNIIVTEDSTILLASCLPSFVEDKNFLATLSKLTIDCAILKSDMGSAGLGYRYLGLLEYSQQNKKAAILYFTKSSVCFEKTNQEKENAIINGLLGFLYQELYLLDKSIECLQKAAVIYLNLGLEIDLANTWNDMGGLYMRQAQYTPALDYFQKAETIILTLKIENGLLAHIYNNIAILYEKKSQCESALNYYKKAEKIQQKLGLEADLADTWNNMGIVYESQTQYTRALEYYRKAETIRQKLGLEADLAATWNNIGVVYIDQTQYARALEYFQKAVVIQQKIGLMIDLATTWHNIGDVYNYQIQYNLALEYYKKTEAIGQELGLKKELADTWLSIGNLYREQEQLLDALKYYQKAEIVYQKFNLEKELATIWLNMANIHQNQTPWGRLEYYKKAEVVYKKLELNNLLAKTWTNMAILHGNLSQYTRALEYYQKAASLKMQSELPTDKSDAMVRLSDIYDKLSLPDSALYYAKESIKYAEQALTGSVDEKSTIKIQQDAYKGYEIAVKYANPKEAIQYGMRLKGRTLAKLLTERSLADIALPQALATEQEDLKADLRFCELLLSKDKLDDSLKVRFRNQRLNVLEKFDIFKSKLRRELPEYAALQYPEPLEIEALQKILKKDETVVEYMMGEENAFAFVTTQDGYTVVPLVKPDSITDWVAKFRENFVEKAQKGSFDRSVIKGFHEASYALYQLLVKPLEDKGLLNGKALMVIADGAIGYIPFDCLVKDEKPSLKWETYQYLIKEYAISYYPSALVLQRQRTVNTAKPAEKDLLAFGDPLFKGNQRLEDYKPDSLGFYVMRDNGFGEYLMPLPGTKSEVEGIAQLFPRSNKTFLQGEATEDNLKATDLTAYRYLHFATHGLINTAYPELSAIALTQDDNPAQDGTVNMFEIFNLKMNADLVVLSACETGLGKVVKGEGMVGFTRGLMYAGARSVVLSLWSVADNSTSALMQDFYKKVLAGKSTKQSSLHSIQLELLKENSAYACPFYWAPFILVGER